MPAWLTAIRATSLQGALDLLTKTIGLVGGAGGLVYWFNLWRSRIRVVANVVDESVGNNVVTIVLDVENLGRQVTSLRPNGIVKVSWQNPSRHQRMFGRTTYHVHVEHGNRSLQP